MTRTIRSLHRAAQRRDSAEEIRDRSRRNIASGRAIEERLAAYPTLDASNAEEAIRYQEARYQEHYNALRRADGLI